MTTCSKCWRCVKWLRMAECEDVLLGICHFCRRSECMYKQARTACVCNDSAQARQNCAFLPSSSTHGHSIHEEGAVGKPVRAVDLCLTPCVRRTDMAANAVAVPRFQGVFAIRVGMLEF